MSESKVGRALVLAVLLAVPFGVGAVSGSSHSQGQPDLTVTGFTASRPDPAGGIVTDEPVMLTVVVANHGNAAATNVLVEIAEIRPDGYRNVLFGHFAQQIPAGTNAIFHSEWRPPVDRVGDTDLAATVDPQSTVSESNEFNNVRHHRVATRVPVSGVLYPHRSVVGASSGPVMLGGEWAVYAFDMHDRNNPGPRMLLDRSGNGNDARMPASPMTDLGVSGLGARFDGAGVYAVDWMGGSVVQAAPAASVELAGLSFWIKIDQRPRFAQYAWSVPAGECYRQAVEVRPEGQLRLWSSARGSGCLNYVESSTRLAPGRWTHVAVSWADGVATLYVDGQPHGAIAPASSPAPSIGTMYLGALNLGDTANTPSGHLSSAVLDEVRLYSRPLTPADVAALYAAGGRA